MLSCSRQARTVSLILTSPPCFHLTLPYANPSPSSKERIHRPVCRDGGPLQSDLVQGNLRRAPHFPTVLDSF